jgi:hypothetical protein
LVSRVAIGAAVALTRMNYEIDIRRTQFHVIENDFKMRVTPEREYITARDNLKIAESKIRTAEASIARMREDYRNLPVEYANLRILESQVQMKDAEADLTQLKEKLAAFGSIPVAGSTADPDDEAWTKLRQRLLGADTAEFDVLKPASRPAFPTSSNRKMLTALGLAAPLFCAYLLLAFIDHWRNPVRVGVDIIPYHASNRVVPHSESALLAVRIQQWISGDSHHGQNSNGEEVPLRRGVIVDPPSKSIPRPNDDFLSS